MEFENVMIYCPDFCSVPQDIPSASVVEIVRSVNESIPRNQGETVLKLFRSESSPLYHHRHFEPGTRPFAFETFTDLYSGSVGNVSEATSLLWAQYSSYFESFPFPGDRSVVLRGTRYLFPCMSRFCDL